MLDVRRMRVLREVALQGSFSAAAESLSFTQSAVSQQIAALERETGTILVQRSARGVRLTEAGEALVRHADAVLARLAEAEAEPQLKSGELDLVLGFGSRFELEDGIERQFLLEDPMLLVLPKDHALAEKRNLRLADLADEAWIGGPQDCECNRLIYGACSGAGYDPRIAFETDHYAAVQGFVAAGVGVSLIAELGLTTIRDDIVVRDLGRETPVRRIYAATGAGYKTPATVAMVEVLREVGMHH